MTNQTIIKNAWAANTLDNASIHILLQEATEHPYCSALQLLHTGSQWHAVNANKKQIINKAYIYSQDPIATNISIAKFTARQSVDLSDILVPPTAENYFDANQITVAATDVEQFVEQQIQKKANSLPVTEEPSDENHLMITRSFDDWLSYFKTKKEQEQKEKESKESVRAMWQKEKLAETFDEETELIPENVFKMAIDSIHLSESAISESLAEILLKQGNMDKAVEMYRKLSLLNPEKSSYFASKLKEISKQQ